MLATSYPMRLTFRRTDLSLGTSLVSPIPSPALNQQNLSFTPQPPASPYSSPRLLLSLQTRRTARLTSKATRPPRTKGVLFKWIDKERTVCVNVDLKNNNSSRKSNSPHPPSRTLGSSNAMPPSSHRPTHGNPGVTDPGMTRSVPVGAVSNGSSVGHGAVGGGNINHYQQPLMPGVPSYPGGGQPPSPLAPQQQQLPPPMQQQQSLVVSQPQPSQTPPMTGYGVGGMWTNNRGVHNGAAAHQQVQESQIQGGQDAPVPTVNAWGKGPPRIQAGREGLSTRIHADISVGSTNSDNNINISSNDQIYNESGRIDNDFNQNNRNNQLNSNSNEYNDVAIYSEQGSWNGVNSVPTKGSIQNSTTTTASSSLAESDTGSLTPPNTITPSASGGNSPTPPSFGGDRGAMPPPGRLDNSQSNTTSNHNSVPTVGGVNDLGVGLGGLDIRGETSPLRNLRKSVEVEEFTPRGGLGEGQPLGYNATDGQFGYGHNNNCQFVVNQQQTMGGLSWEGNSFLGSKPYGNNNNQQWHVFLLDSEDM